MNLQYLCTNCLNGTLQNGICASCHKHAGDTAPRKPNTLPDRYMLGSRYYLGRVIGKGGFGITYMAWDRERRERVIVKELYPSQDVTRDPHTGRVTPVPGQEACFQKYKQRFKEEAQTLYSFQREPTILNVYGLLEANGTVYYSMEYLSGWDMKTFLQNQGKIGWGPAFLLCEGYSPHAARDTREESDSPGYHAGQYFSHQRPERETHRFRFGALLQ